MKRDHVDPLNDCDDVATLVRLGGKRRAVPRDCAERVKAAARARWRQETLRRSRKRIGWAAAGMATAASLLLAVGFWVVSSRTGFPTRTEAAVRVEALSGPAWSESPERRALVLGEDVDAASELVTDEDSRVAIRLASGHSVRLDSSTRIRLLDRGALALDRGSIYVDSDFEAETVGSLVVRTPYGAIEELGTQFEVRLEDDAVRVRLREGAVVVHGSDRDHGVQAGEELTVNRDGSIVRRAISTHASEWGWIVDVTPMLDLEGRSARSFVEWVARERGWTLAFTDEAVARSADEIVLGGTVEKLTLEEALDAVLPTCGLNHRVDGGILVIAAR